VVPFRSLLARDNPDALVLALLCDFGDRDPQLLVNDIFMRLRALCGDSEKRLREYIDMIEVLSENRDLNPYIREAERMLTQVDITRLPSYELGMEKGMEQGIERGIEKGMEQGIEKGKAAGAMQAGLAVARNLLKMLDDDQIAETTGLSRVDVAKLRSGQLR
jgi:predicted transposase/invertase (TIGR01784 family)